MAAGRQRIDMTGQKYGMLTVVEYVRREPNGYSVWLTRCECGAEREVSRQQLRTGTKTCGHRECKIKSQYSAHIQIGASGATDLNAALELLNKMSTRILNLKKEHDELKSTISVQNDCLKRLSAENESLRGGASVSAVTAIREAAKTFDKIMKEL